MKIEDIKIKIESSEFYKNNDIKQLIELVIDLYESYRIENTILENDGDMLLFQCGEDSLSKDYFIVRCRTVSGSGSASIPARRTSTWR